ncbi:MAG: PDZ domain-containing protein [Patescibacteria group bacterium]
MKKPTNLFILIVVSLAFGTLAGVAGSMVATSYWGSNLESLTGARDVNLADSIYSRANLIIQDAKKVVVNQDVKVDETIAALQPVLLSAFKNEAGSKDYYNLTAPDAYGFILSNDGWVVLNGVKDNNLENIKKYSAISYDKKMYEVDQAVTVKISGDGSIILAHLKSAINLPVRKMANPSDLQPGTTLLVVSPSGQTLISSLVSKKRPELQLTSDRPDILLKLSDNLGEEFKNSFVFNLGGDFVGFIDSDLQARPNYVFLPAWRTLVAAQKSVFPSLGVNYLNLAIVKAPSLKIDKGAWLKEIEANGPANKAGLKEGDVITRIDDQELDSAHDLSEVLSAYSAGDVIYVTYNRNGEQGGVEIKLGEIK